MGISTDGQICFGISFEENTEFPWDTDDYEGEIERWWMAIQGYSGKRYPEEGYYEEQKQWRKENPCPVEVVLHCSYDYPMYILAVPGTEISASRGYPVSFDPHQLPSMYAKGLELENFCKQYGIDIGDEKPQWWLSSLWG